MSDCKLPDPHGSGLRASPPHSFESLAAFDAKAKAWEEYTNTSLGQLRQELAQRYLEQRLRTLPPRLAVLDAGGGTGGYALPLAQQGHRVCLLDFSSQMLNLARQKAEQLDPFVLERLAFYQAPVQDIPGLFAEEQFDLVLCHTLLEYVAEPWIVLRALIDVLKPGGLLSLLMVNPYADALRWAIARGDLEKARLALQKDDSCADLFGLPRRTFTAGELKRALGESGVETTAEYGVRVFADYMPAGQLADPGFRAQLIELEVAAGALAPYRQIARYNLILGTKAGR